MQQEQTPINANSQTSRNTGMLYVTPLVPVSTARPVYGLLPLGGKPIRIIGAEGVQQ